MFPFSSFAFEIRSLYEISSKRMLVWLHYMKHSHHLMKKNQTMTAKNALTYKLEMCGKKINMRLTD